MTAPTDRPAIVATVGTTGTFPRFSSIVDAIHAARPEVVIQFQAGRGAGSRIPGRVEFLPREELLAAMRAATLVLCHGGSGSVRDALRSCGNVAVVPRRAGVGEGVVDDHQLDLAQALEERGLVRVVSSATEVLEMLDAGRRVQPAAPSDLPGAVVEALRTLTAKRP